MAKKYIFVRMPENVYNLYKNIKVKMEADIGKVTGKQTSLPMTKVFRAVASPDINENYIQIDVKDLLNLARNKKK
jgi:hypothetical protein